MQHTYTLRVLCCLIGFGALLTACSKEPVGPQGPDPAALINTAELRALFTGSTTAAPNGRKITGIVISDRTTGNINGQNIYLQQGTGKAGICVRFTASHAFNLGDSIDVEVSGQEISEYRGLLQVNNVPLSYASLVASGKSITPRSTTIADINTNYEAWESTLVQITGITSITGGSNGTWSGSVTINSGANSLIIFTSYFAGFAGVVYPSNPQRITGYLTPFNTTKQLALRAASDAN
ncbi:MAG: hypothetical protein FJX92_04490 [Bacteroidetes bacterium]|nr:hypothetical protein [Bacteroidota bacterium]